MATKKTAAKKAAAKKAVAKKAPSKTTAKKLQHATAEQIVETAQSTRPLDGSKNNTTDCHWGAVGSTLLRLTPPAHEGPHHTCLAVHKRVRHDDPLNPRRISNLVCREDEILTDASGRTHWMWAWGQFLDHQLDLTNESDEVIALEVSPDDPHVPPEGLTIHFKRSKTARGTGIRYDVPREHANELSAYIDASSVYGNDSERLLALVDGGTGKLKQSANGLLPLKPAAVGLDNAQPDGFGADGTFFLAGDVRVNEHVVLTSLHTIFVRLHNLRVDALIAGGENDPLVLFAKARAWVAAVMQFITYREFIPELLGKRAVSGEWGYRGYVDTTETTISTEFSTSAYRLGHSMLPASVPVTDAAVEFSNEVDGVRRLDLKDAFFKPELIATHGTATFVDLLHTEAMRSVDPVVSEGLRNFLFRFPNGAGGTDLGLLDLAALNIMRGRDHRLGTYNDVREGLGMARKASISEITGDTEMVRRLEAAYGDVDKVDLWVGGLCESSVHDAAVGETFYAILHDQFIRLRDGDRWHWRNDNFPRFGEHIVCNPCCDHPDDDDAPYAEADPVLSEHERDEITAGGWTLARVLLETGSVSPDALEPTTNVFNVCGDHRVTNVAPVRENACDTSHASPGYRTGSDEICH